MTREEIGFIAHCESECFSRPWTQEEIAAVYGSGYGISAVLPGVGFALGRISFDEAELYRIAVLPEKRRMNAGTQLIEGFIEKCSEKGVRRIFLEVRSLNSPAVGLYEKTGFRMISVRKGYYGDDDALVYLLEIDCK